jgi:hypothetical protein
MLSNLTKIFFFILFFIFQNIYPCSVPLPGQYTSVDQIIKDSKTIFLVKLTKSNQLKIIEVLKGDTDLLHLNWLYYQPAGTYLNNYTNENSGNHFSNHTDINFWTDAKIGRSPFPCCVCGPIHEFKINEEYLIFPDQLGSMKSAEIIRSKEDKLYKYVEEKTKIKK